MEKLYMKTISTEWIKNLATGILVTQGNIQGDFWLRTPGPIRDYNKVAVCFNKKLLFEGDAKDQYKADAKTIYGRFSTSLYSIGLEPRTTIENFEELLKNTFSGDYRNNEMLENIIFKVTGVTQEFLDMLEEFGFDVNKFQFLKSIPIIESKQIGFGSARYRYI